MLYWKNIVVRALLVGAPIAVAHPATAQIQPVVFGGSEVQTGNASVVVLGTSLQTAQTGWAPTAGLVGLMLNQPAGAGSERSFAVAPSVGLRHSWPVGAIQGSVGYLFLTNEAGGIPGLLGFTESGITTALQADYWGAGDRAGSAIVNYNWGAEYLWSRIRGSQRIAQVGNGFFRVGGEVVGQGGGERLNDADLTYQVGSLVEWVANPNVILIGAGGVTTASPGMEGRNNLYFKVEFVLLP